MLRLTLINFVAAHRAARRIEVFDRTSSTRFRRRGRTARHRNARFNSRFKAAKTGKLRTPREIAFQCRRNADVITHNDTASIHNASGENLKIALIGDSMIERWGDCSQLTEELARIYSRTTFEIENHGLKGSRAGFGLWRIAHDYKDKDGVYIPCVSFGNPDIVVVESFAYSNCNDDVESLPEYRDVLRDLWGEVQRTTAAKILFFVGIPPDRDRFLETSNNFYHTSKITRQRMADRADLYLQEALMIAQDEEWPVADAYTDVQKRVANGDKLRRYINQSDCVTPSLYGYQAMARIIARAFDRHELVKEAATK